MSLPHIPPARRIGQRRRRELAGLWLLRLGLRDDPDRVEELAPVTGRYPQGTVIGEIADELVVAGQIPTRGLVTRRFLTISDPAESPSCRKS